MDAHLPWFNVSPWTLVGLIGQFIFGTRFLVQWIASERKGESVVPISFWWISIVGSLISLVYGIGQRDLAITAGYLFNCIPYVRNLVLIYRKREADPARTPGTS
jgi:lipid-A-disaccharide synthase-like uncharacterized protein